MRKRTRMTFSALGLVAMLTMAGCGAGSGGNNASGNNGAGVNNTANGTAMNATNDANGTGNGAGNAATADGKPQWSQPPAMQIDKNKQYTALVHTNYGDFTIQLFAKDTPKTVNNFVFLAEHQFYNGDTFFRIIKTFMVQTGDPVNNGTGGPGYQFADELPPKYPYAPGFVAMANAGPNTNGSQFFVCTGADSESLNQQPNYTEFGKVISGMNVVQKIASIPVKANPMSGEMSMPTKKAYIESIDISAK